MLADFIEGDKSQLRQIFFRWITEQESEIFLKTDFRVDNCDKDIDKWWLIVKIEKAAPYLLRALQYISNSFKIVITNLVNFSPIRKTYMKKLVLGIGFPITKLDLCSVQ